MGRYVKPTNGEKIEKESLMHNLDKRKQAKFAVGNAGNGVLIVLDKKIVSQAEFQTINPDDIESMNVYKDNKEVAKYTTKNYNGVIVFTLKKKRRNKRRNK
jgi:soluble P-type ATPase